MPNKSRHLRGIDADYCKKLSKKDREWLRAFEAEYYRHGARRIQSPEEYNDRRRSQLAAQRDALSQSDTESLDSGPEVVQPSPEDGILAQLDVKRRTK